MYIWNEVDTEEHAPLRGGHYMYYYTPQMSMPLFRKSPISAGLFCNRNCNRDMICKEPANYGYLTMLLHCSLSPTCTNSFSAYRPDCPAENTPRDTAKINLVFVLWLCCFLMQPVGWRQDWRVIIRVMALGMSEGAWYESWHFGDAAFGLDKWVKRHDTSHYTSQTPFRVTKKPLLIKAHCEGPFTISHDTSHGTRETFTMSSNEKRICNVSWICKNTFIRIFIGLKEISETGLDSTGIWKP